MPHVDPTNYPTNLPEGAFHLDTDEVDDWRLPRSLDHDYVLWQENYGDGPLRWVIRENARSPSFEPSPAILAAAATLARDRRIRTLESENRNLQQRLASPPTASSTANTPTTAHRASVRIGTPRVFSAVPNDKGEYDPTPRDFVRSVKNYLSAHATEGIDLPDERQITIIATFMDQAAAMWYEQVVKKFQEWQQQHAIDPSLRYEGPLRDTSVFLEALLQQFEDVDIRKTAIHKIKTLQQGKNTAESHIRLFRDWAEHTGFNDAALVEYFKEGLQPTLRNRVNNQGKHRPTTLEGWYEDTIIFDRQWREDHPGRASTRPLTTSTHLPFTRNIHPSSLLRQKNTHQGVQRDPNSLFRPWRPSTPPMSPPKSNDNIQAMDIDAITRDLRCFKCGKEGHIARWCPTPGEEIQLRSGRNRRYSPLRENRPPRQNRATSLTNASELVNSLTAGQREELIRALQLGDTPEVDPTPSTGQQDFGEGSV